MIIERDIAAQLQSDKGYYIQIVIGPRQCGKNTLLSHISPPSIYEANFDDLQTRRLANEDPAFFISQHPAPLLIDEAQYAPNIFPELKKIVDDLKKQRLLQDAPPPIETLYRLTGSNQILMDKSVKESLVGRAGYYYMNTLTVHEILNAFPEKAIQEILFKGGWPELYINKELAPMRYLSDYVRHYIEKDIVLSAGIVKQQEFHTILGMLAARTAGFLNASAIARDSGVKSNTIREWISILERTQLVYLLQPCENNINKRLVKSPKVYFLDTGLAIRLQGWNEMEPLMKSPQAGPMFETLVLAEIIKFINNNQKNWKISVWRTKEGDEIDFVIETEKNAIIALDAKMGIHSVRPESLPASFKNVYKETKLTLVSAGGKRQNLSPDCIQVPISELVNYLLEFE